MFNVRDGFHTMNIPAASCGGSRRLSRLLPYTFVLAAVGCASHHGNRLDTTGVVDVLQAQPEARRDLHTALALDLAREDQRLEGLPAKSLDVPALLALNRAANTNAGRPANAPPETILLDDATAALLQKAVEALARERTEAEALQQRGRESEEREQRRLGLLARLAALIGVPLGALIAALACFPALLPVAGRVCAWLVARIPSLASALGVVGVKAFDAVVRGVEETRNAAPADVRNLANEQLQPAAPKDVLAENLSSAMDRDHKRLVRSRRAKLLVNRL